MKSAGLACLIFVFVLQSHSALAKGLELDHAVLEGPGLDLPLEVSREEFGIVRSESSPTAVALARLFGNKSQVPPPGSLGPDFELSYHLNVGLAPDVAQKAIRLTLYPYAENGPVMFVPPGLTVTDVEEIESGWEAFPPALVQNLQSAGMPSESTARDAASSPIGPWLVPIVVVLLIAIIVFSNRFLTKPLRSVREAAKRSEHLEASKSSRI